MIVISARVVQIISPRGRDDPPPVGAERGVVERQGVPSERGDGAARLEVPDLGSLIVRRGDDPVAGGAERCGGHGVAVPLERGEILARPGIPDLRRSIE